MKSETDGRWQESWKLFAEALERQLQDGATSRELSEFFSGKAVRWRGILERVSVDEVAPSVDIALPEQTINVGNGKKAVLDGVHVPVAASAVADWRGLCAGSDIAFCALVEQAEAPFPPVEVVTLKSGRAIVMLRLHSGIPIGPTRASQSERDS